MGTRHSNTTANQIRRNLEGAIGSAFSIPRRLPGRGQNDSHTL